MYRLHSIVRTVPIARSSVTSAIVARPAAAVVSGLVCAHGRSYSSETNTAKDDPNAALVQQLKTDMKSGMRAKDSVAVTVIRGIISDISYAEKSPKGPPMQYLSLILAAHKRRQDSIAMFQAANRADLVEKEQAELAVLERYMPKVLNDQEIQQRVMQLCQSLDVKSKKDTGKFMAAVNADKELGLVDKKVLVAAMDKYLQGQQ